jgi:pimeloyl-ACP methyl ester carboxylesterase
MTRTDDNPHGADRSVFEAVWAAWRTDWPRWVAENAPAFAGVGRPGCAPSPHLVSAGIRDMDQTSLLALLQVSQSVVDTDFRPELARLDLPTLVLHGTHDASNPLDSTGRQTARLVPGAELRIYENAPHGLVVTHLDQLAADIAGFAAARRLRTRDSHDPAGFVSS